jgi:amino acid permease
MLIQKANGSDVTKPVWLRIEPAYRVQIRAERSALILGCCLPLIFLSSTHHLISIELTKILGSGCVIAGSIAVVVAAICWIVMPDKDIAAAEGGFPLMMLHDVFLGLPRMRSYLPRSDNRN